MEHHAPHTTHTHIAVSCDKRTSHYKPGALPARAHFLPPAPELGVPPEPELPEVLFERPPPLGLPVVEGQPPPLPWPDMLVAVPPFGILVLQVSAVSP